MFEQELDELTRRLGTVSPRSPPGTVHRVIRGSTVRKVLLTKTEQHVYYSIDEANDMVVIRTIWGARRGRTPKL